ncbi:hypothetical protein IDJ77_12810 [Mucilaginibacter sp. ZT4R22]|uniref:Uncharacterized protein n=1 Tax=Mucilaginibacter pankratovii TaxID=2772110 RepID=A0ABR7WQT6_9SPHI|nr:hypothetical protein [Mucilaginibacter pankratovii]MBD1364693.1 hypothetical protein [Mucilaginibacter pankratovii]
MIKKQGALLLALLYTVTVAGFALNLHYCGSHVADVQINAPAKSCTTPMAKSKMNCCKDSKLDVKVKDDHQKESTSFFSRLFAFELPKFPLADFLLSAQQSVLEKLFDRGPPDVPSEGIAVFLKNCIFRI